MIIDFHIHTHHSYDCQMKPDRIIQIAKKRNLSGIVVCDHDTIKGGLECQAINDDENFWVIIGTEIQTDVGDVTGIFLENEIETHNFSEVIQEIRNQNGLTILNHPYKKHRLNEIDLTNIDMIEGFNSRVDRSRNLAAVKLAKKYNKPIVAGSDAHFYFEIGNGKTYYDSKNILYPVKTEYKKSPVYSETISQFIKAWKNRDIHLFLKILKGTPKKIILSSIKS